MLPRSGTTIELATGCGPAVLHRDRVTMVVPGTAEIVALSSIQTFLPIGGTTWTAVLSTASAFAELTEPLETLLRSVAESVSVGDGSERDDSDHSDDSEGAGDALPPDVMTAAARPDWMPADHKAGDPSAAGFERGFGTLVRRRIGE